MSDAPKPLREEPDALGALLAAASNPIEPPVGTQARNWAHVESQLTRRPVWWPRLLAASAAALCGVVLTVAVARSLSAPHSVLAVQGSVTLTQASSTQVAAVGDAVPNDAQLSTSADGRATLALAGATMTVLEDTRLSTVHHPGGSVTVKLAHGEVALSSQKRAKGAELFVDASSYRVTVVGTVFSVEARGSEVWVRVGHGTVHVTGPGTDVMLTAPASWSSVPAAAKAPMSAAEVDAVEHEPRAPDRYARARDQEAAERAATGLALYEAARTLLAAGDASAAADRFGEYGQRFPDGPLAQEAALNQLEALLNARRYAEVTREADAFLTRFTASERRDEVTLIKANVLKDAGACDKALALYDVLQATAGAQREEALFFAGVCHARLGNVTKAKGLFRSYVERFSDGRFAAEAARALESP